MKKLLITIVAIFPLMCEAQTVKTLTPEQQLEQAQKQLEEAQKAVEAAKANAQKASKAAAEAKAKAEAEQQRKAKELAEKQAAIQAQIKKAQEEAARLNAEAEKLNAEAKRIGGEASATSVEKPQAPVVTSDQTKMVKQETKSDKVKKENPVQYESANGWSAVATPTPTVKIADKKEKEKNEYDGYLVGAVPLVDGKVVFTQSFDYPGKTAGELYEKSFEYVNNLTVDENQNTDSKLRSRISIVNKNTHSIAAKMYEWLVFTNTMLMSDRTEFTYTLIVNCVDNRIDVKMERMSYKYEANRSTGFTEPAQNIIADKYALNKKQDKVVRPYGKFRVKTIDRKNVIFKGLANLFAE